MIPVTFLTTSPCSFTEFVLPRNVKMLAGCIKITTKRRGICAVLVTVSKLFFNIRKTYLSFVSGPFCITLRYQNKTKRWKIIKGRAHPFSTKHTCCSRNSGEPQVGEKRKRSTKAEISIVKARLKQLVDAGDSIPTGLGKQADKETGMGLSNSTIWSLERNPFHGNFNERMLGFVEELCTKVPEIYLVVEAVQIPKNSSEKDRINIIRNVLKGHVSNLPLIQLFDSESGGKKISSDNIYILFRLFVAVRDRANYLRPYVTMKGCALDGTCGQIISISAARPNSVCFNNSQQVKLGVGVFCQNHETNYSWCLKHFLLANGSLLLRDNLLCRVDATKSALRGLASLQRCLGENRTVGIKRIYFGLCMNTLCKQIVYNFGQKSADLFYDLFGTALTETALEFNAKEFQRRCPQVYEYLVTNYGSNFSLFTNTISNTGEVCNYCSLSSDEEVPQQYFSSWADVMESTLLDFFSNPNMSPKEMGSVSQELNRIMSENKVKAQQFEAVYQGGSVYTVSRKNTASRQGYVVSLSSPKVTLESAVESQRILKRILREHDTNERHSSTPTLPGSDQSGNKFLSFGTCSCGVPNLTRIACPHMHAVFPLVGSSEYYSKYYTPTIPTLNASGNTLYSFSGGSANRSILGPISLCLQEELEEFQSCENRKGDIGGVTKAHCRVLFPRRSWNEISEILELKPPTAGKKVTLTSVTDGDIYHPCPDERNDEHIPELGSVKRTLGSFINGEIDREPKVAIPNDERNEADTSNNLKTNFGKATVASIRNGELAPGPEVSISNCPQKEDEPIDNPESNSGAITLVATQKTGQKPGGEGNKNNESHSGANMTPEIGQNHEGESSENQKSKLPGGILTSVVNGEIGQEAEVLTPCHERQEDGPDKNMETNRGNESLTDIVAGDATIGQKDEAKDKSELKSMNTMKRRINRIRKSARLPKTMFTRRKRKEKKAGAKGYCCR